MGKDSYMALGLYNRIYKQSKDMRIIDMFETQQGQKEVFRVDEDFEFRTRA